MTGIYIGGPTKDYSAMQGPAPSGFHVPLNTEWQAVYNIWTALGGGSADGTNFGIALKLPFAGRRLNNDSNVRNQGTNGFYWSSSPYPSGANNSYRLYFLSSSVSPQGNSYRASGFSVRCFKNSPTVPTSSWTKLYGTSIEAGGIFWSSTDGLISLSSDGQTWITIADKNLGATTVWNNGDTLSEANCGKYYQWGNNYGFPFTGSVTTSGTQVDASTYGPGNYYSSSTFITRSSSPYNWDSSDNGNLRGGVTGVVEKTGEVKSIYVGTTPVKAVFVGTTKVRPSTDTRTFTITRTEQSNMSSGWTYSDDAAGLTAGSTAFDEFFGYYGCKLNYTGQELATITQEQSGGAGKLDITQLGNLAQYNIMIAFPVMGIKMTKSGSTVTLSITKELNKTGYQYYAHCTGTLSNPGTPKDVFYLGAYKASLTDTSLFSHSGKTPLTNRTQSTFCTFAGNDGRGHNIIGYYQRMFVNCLYMMKYGNPKSQSVVGYGYTSGSSIPSTGATNSITNATGATNTTTTGRIKLFGLEDRWGNVSERVGGAYTTNKVLYTQLSGYSGTASGGSNTGSTLSVYSAGDELSSIAGNNNALFGATNSVFNEDYLTYYGDAVGIGASGSHLFFGGGYRSSGYSAGAFFLRQGSTSYKDASVGSRLMYLNGLT